jgi:drug/metabolite transporter (DMT)-like permease
MSAVLASIMLKERLTLLRIACFVIGLAGVALLSIQDFRQSSFGEMKYLEGNALILAVASARRSITFTARAC